DVLRRTRHHCESTNAAWDDAAERFGVGCESAALDSGATSTGRPCAHIVAFATAIRGSVDNVRDGTRRALAGMRAERHVDRETSAVAGRVAGRPPPAMGGHDGLDDGKTESAAAGGTVTMRTRGVRAPETVEHLRGLAVGETRAVVDHLDQPLPVAR